MATLLEFHDKGFSIDTKILYHGTDAKNIPSILTHSFRLPQRIGAFGKGIYLGQTNKAECFATNYRKWEDPKHMWGFSFLVETGSSRSPPLS